MPNYPLDPPLLFAPMEGLGERAFLAELDRVGGAGCLFTRFLRVTATGCAPGPETVLPAPGRTPLAVQLLGRLPERMGEAAREAEALGASAIDLNFGCPSATVTRKGCGAAILDEPDLTRRIVRAVRAAVRIPVSAKLRLGMGTRDAWRAVADGAAEEGADLVILHGRAGADGYGGDADWAAVAEAARRLPVPVCGNGDIRSGVQAVARMEATGCAAVMIGRAAVADPWIFRHAVAARAGGPVRPTPAEDLLAHHERLYARLHALFGGERMALSRMKAHAALFLSSRGTALAPEGRAVLRAKGFDEYLAALSRALRGSPELPAPFPPAGGTDHSSQ